MKTLRVSSILVFSIFLLLAIWYVEQRRPYTLRPAPDIGLANASEHTQWPWRDAQQTRPQRGLTHWFVQAQDGTLCDLVKFDFAANPALRFELYSQDEDDAKPGDNVVQFWPMGVGQATRHLNERLAKQKAGEVIACWNGPFFGYHRVAPIPKETGFHLAPVVLRGKVLYNTSNHRWSFGVKYVNGKPRFKAVHLPGRAVLQREFDFAGGSIQNLIQDGKPLKLEPFPRGPRDFRKPPVPSTPVEAGHIPYFDHAKFSRASLAWSKDHQQLYLLMIREPNSDSEGQSIEDLAKWKPQSRGWNVPDVQRFWLSLRDAGLVWNAINSDAGDCGQMTLRRPDKKYLLVSPLGDNRPAERQILDANFAGAPQGGAVMYFYVRDNSKS